MIGTVVGTSQVQAQLTSGTPDRPITAPSLPALETPGLSSDPLKSLHGLGGKPADEALKRLDKDLGRSSRLAPDDDPPRDRPMEGPRYRPGEDLGKDSSTLSY